MKRKFDVPEILQDPRLPKMAVVAEQRNRILAAVTAKIIKDGGDDGLNLIDPIMKKFADFIETTFADESYHVMAIAAQCIADALLAETFDIEDIH